MHTKAPGFVTTGSNNRPVGFTADQKWFAEKGGSIPVRAANAISMLDGVTQNPQMQSHIRSSLWQVDSALESIRE